MVQAINHSILAALLHRMQTHRRKPNPILHSAMPLRKCTRGRKLSHPASGKKGSRKRPQSKPLRMCRVKGATLSGLERNLSTIVALQGIYIPSARCTYLTCSQVLILGLRCRTTNRISGLGATSLSKLNSCLANGKVSSMVVHGHIHRDVIKHQHGQNSLLRRPQAIGRLGPPLPAWSVIRLIPTISNSTHAQRMAPQGRRRTVRQQTRSKLQR